MIHKFSQNGYYIVLDVNSGAVHVLDELCYDVVDYTGPGMTSECPEEALAALSKKYREGDIREAYAELLDLTRKGHLHASDDDYAVYAKQGVESPVKALCLNVAHDCNLRCEYCFASKGDFGHGRKLMPLEVGKKAIDFLIEHSGKRHNLEVDFFGGEPLMNFEVVRGVVDYARLLEPVHNKNFRFTITTNGVLLNKENMEYINREMSNIVLSLDGRREVNDRLRVFENGSGSHDTIIPKYQELIASRDRGKDYYVRGTFTTHNLDFTEDVKYIRSLGFDQISIEPVVSDPKLDYSIQETDLKTVYREYEKLADYILAQKKAGDSINFFHFMIDLDQGPCAIKRLRGCGCGNEYVAITPEGDIYPCHQFIGTDGYWKMGSVLDDTFREDIKKRFSKANIYGKPACRECWARFYCSGGCNANNQQYAGDVLGQHKLACDLMKKRLECAIMIKVALAADEGRK